MNTTNTPKRLQHTASGKPEAPIPSADELVARKATEAERRCSCEYDPHSCAVHGVLTETGQA